ncbi:mucin-21-like [Drosophila biarmipes]|uniref:mucin-21-like n=1 Tax=Drosophila biarmipes TaxID=125945 RepID=UPI001CDA9095|nr:mucin-21-like [Drosophila biarmipes]
MLKFQIICVCLILCSFSAVVGKGFSNYDLSGREAYMSGSYSSKDGSTDESADTSTQGSKQDSTESSTDASTESSTESNTENSNKEEAYLSPDKSEGEGSQEGPNYITTASTIHKSPAPENNSDGWNTFLLWLLSIALAVAILAGALYCLMHRQGSYSVKDQCDNAAVEFKSRRESRV